MSQILISTNNNDGSYYHSINEAVNQTISKNLPNSVIYIVPTGKIVRHLEKQYLFKYHQETGKPLEKLKIFTLQTFTRYLFQKLFPVSGRIVVSEAYRLALFEEAAENANLQFFKGKSNNLSYNLLKRLSDVIMGLREDGIELDDIKNNLEYNNTNNNILAVDLARLEDLYSLYAAYEDILSENYLDFSKMLKLVTDKLSEKECVLRNLFPNINQIIIEGFSEFQKPELKFIQSIGCHKLPVVINIKYDEIKGPLYTIMEHTISGLLTNGFRYLNNDNNSQDDSYTDFLKKNLFDWDSNKDKTISKFTKVLEAPTRIEEVILISRLVKYLIQEEGYKPSDICISTRQPNLYSNLFREVLFTHKIPANVTDRYELAKSPVISGIISALNLISNDFSIDDLIKFLNNPYVNILDERGNKINSENIVSILIELKISGGRKQGGLNVLLKRLEDNKLAFEKRLEVLGSDRMIEERDSHKARKTLSKIKEAIKDLSLIRIKFLDASDKLLPSQFTDFINSNIISGFSIKQNIYSRVDLKNLSERNIPPIEKNHLIEEIEKDIKAVEALENLLHEMSYILSDRYPNKKFSFSQISEKLKTAITGSKYQVFEKVGYGVTVTTIEQTRQIPNKVSILCGAVDSEFPTQYKSETFLGMKLPDSEQRHILSERMQFFQFLTNGTEFISSNEKRIYISYPKFTDEQELIRSSFVDALLRISTIAEDNCLIDYSIIKSGLMQNIFKSKAVDYLSENPWLYSVASDIDLQSLYAETILNDKPADSDFFNSLNIINTRDNIEKYIKHRINEKKDIVQIDKKSLPNELKEKLETISSGSFSITSLEQYAKCPYRYFLTKILQLEEEQELELAITPQEMGSLMHKILYSFYSEKLYSKYQENHKKENDELPKIIPINLEPDEKEKYQSELHDIAEKLIEDLHFEHPLFYIDKKTVLGDSGRQGLLEIWLERELERIRNGWGASPVLFEFGFGMKSLNDNSIDHVSLDGLKIKGKIDRIEKLNDCDEFIIADYKLSSSNIPTTKQIKEGVSFQIPLYMLAMKQILDEHYNLSWEPSAGIYYFFKTKMEKQKILDSKAVLTHKDGKFKNYYNLSNSPLEKQDTIEDILSANLKAAKEITEKISNGVFDIKPIKGACDYCSFKSICRIDFI